MPQVPHQEYTRLNDGPKALGWARRLVQRPLTTRVKRQSAKKMRKAEVEEDMCRS